MASLYIILLSFNYLCSQDPAIRYTAHPNTTPRHGL